MDIDILNSKEFIKKEKETYKQYIKQKYSVNLAWYKAFHDTIEYFKNR